MRARILTAALFSLVTCALHAREVRVSEAVFGTPPGFRAQPAIQHGGDGYLVAWVDERLGTMVFAARLNDAGEVLDRSGFALGETHYYRDARPQIIWNGEAWLVFFSSRGQLLMVRVAPDGTRSEPRVIVQQARSDARGRSIATNGKIIVVTYTVELYVPGTHVLVLSMNGDRISDREVDPHAATAGMVVERDGEFAVAWNNFTSGNAELFAIRLDGSGNLLDAAPRSLGKSSTELELTRHGNGYLVLEQHWGADRWEFTSHAVSADLATATTPAYVQISETRRTFVQDGTSAVLIAASGSKFQAVHFDDSGHQVRSDDILQSALPLGDVAMTRIASGFAASWIVIENEYEPRLVAAKLDAAFRPTTPQRAVSETALPQAAAAVAFGAAEMVVAWIESPGLRLARFSYDGVRLGADIVLDDFGGTGIRPVSLLFDGERYVVAYRGRQNPVDAVIHFITPRGELLPDSVHLPGDYSTFHIALAKGRSTTIALWSRSEGVFAAALSGTTMTAQPRVLASGVIGNQIAAAWNGDAFVVVWFDGVQTIEWPVYNQLGGAFVSEDLGAVDRRVFAQGGGSRFPNLDAAARGTTVFVAYEHGPNIKVSRIEKDGSVATTPVSMAGYAPRLASDGSRVDLAWTDGDLSRLRVAPLTDTGTLKNEGLTFPNLYAPDFFGGLARRGELSAVVYSRVVAEAGTMPRAFLSLTDETPNPGRRRSAR